LSKLSKSTPRGRHGIVSGVLRQTPAEREYISLEHAVDLLLERVQPLNEPEQPALLEAAERVAFADIRASLPQPPFDRSVLDGYALHHEDTVEASRATPVRLKVTQHIFAGDGSGRPLPRGEAGRIMTGAMLPQGADCVIGQEDTDAGRDWVLVYRPAQRLQNICFCGENVAKGQVLALRGQKLHYAHIGLLAGQGLAAVSVFRRINVAVVSTGDELIPAGSPPAPGKIYDSSSLLLGARLRSLGIRPVLCSCCRDDVQRLYDGLQTLLRDNDMVITTGGVSMGERDCLPAVAAMLGGRILFHGIQIKPGSPALAVVKDGKILLCLSGNPYAASATFEVLAVPALHKLSGNNEFRPIRQNGISQNEFGKAGGMRRLVRARINGQKVFIPPHRYASGMLHTLAECNCMIDIPAGAPPLRKGTPVEVIVLKN
jgi:molybdopterin molybdotransferase